MGRGEPGAANQFGGRQGINQFAGRNGSTQFTGRNGANQFVGHNGANQFVGRNGANQLAQFHGLNTFNRQGFNRNAFGDRQGWNQWGGRHWASGWHRWGAGWGGWVGPVFWPFFYGDVFTYALWPDADYDPFWAYGPDYMLTSVFWPGPDLGPQYGYNPGPGYDVYGGEGAAGDRGSVGSGGRRGTRAARSHENSTTQELARTQEGRPERNGEQTQPSAEELAQTCSGLAPGITDFPIDRIERAVQPTSEQRAALDELRAASTRARDIVKASCPTEVPLTPLGRLDAVEKRLNAMIEALQIVRSPLESFYNSLSDEQKRRFDALGAEAGLHASQDAAPTNEPPNNKLVAICDQRAGSFTQLPVQRIQETMDLNKQQLDAFEDLKQASVKAADLLQNSCPTAELQTPVERLEAVEKRLRAMVAAMEELRPALSTFYSSLSDEQKARFNTVGRIQRAEQPQQTGGRQD